MHMKQKEDILYMVMPAYNEEANIQNVLNQWYGVIADLNPKNKIVIVNDGSTDNTLTILRNYAKNHKQLQIIHTKNQGHGRALLLGYQYAVASGADYIFQTDSDGQTMPRMFHQLWNNRRKQILLIGYRKYRRDGLSRKIVTKVLRMILCLIFGHWMKDANCPYRLMDSHSLKQILTILPNNSELTNVLITAAYTCDDRDIQYYNIPFRPRQGGINSVRWTNIIPIGFRNLKTFWAFRNRLLNWEGIQCE